MRSVIRPVLITLAVAGLSLAGAVSAEAHSGQAVHNDNDTTNVNVWKRIWSTEVETSIDDSFNHNAINSFNGSIIFGNQ
ncbi:hypothetical protein ACMA1D_07370 [Streptomyces sp. 796.1]|uniref:hypothetical protein n=1 Tax=unclassified Streptomyces TaxID=2593676 RepID=UPI0032EEF3E9